MPVAGLRSGLPRPVGTVQPLVPRSAEPSVRWAALSPRHHRGTATKPCKGPARCAETTTGVAGLKIVSLCEAHHSRSPLNYRELPLPDCRRHKMIDRCLSALATGYVTCATGSAEDLGNRTQVPSIFLSPRSTQNVGTDLKLFLLGSTHSGQLHALPSDAPVTR